MKCPACDGRGFIEGHVGISASFTPSIEQCPKRCDISAYSKEVQRRLNNPAHITERPVLQSKPPEKPKPRLWSVPKKEKEYE